jgi:ribosomal protein S18 acetylase RimI-like enzyme
VKKSVIGLRRATTQDLEYVLELVEAFYAEDRHTFDSAHCRAALVPLLESDTAGCVWLTEGVAGYVIVTWGYSIESGGREALIDELYIAERNRGYGTLLMQSLLPLLVEHGAKVLFLETELHNDRARRFYERIGLTAEDSIWMEMRLTGDGTTHSQTDALRKI